MMLKTTRVQCTVVVLFRQGVTKLFQKIKMFETVLLSYKYEMNDSTLYGLRVLSLI